MEKMIVTAYKKYGRHGLINTRIYRTWQSMKSRCCNPNTKSYARYGGRGITVCDEWHTKFMCFYTWAIANGYEEHLTIDRIDNDGDYSPGNCKWSTRKEQNNNSSKNRKIEINGIVKNLQQWADFYGIDADALSGRIKRGWSKEDYFIKPQQGNRYYSSRLGRHTTS